MPTVVLGVTGGIAAYKACELVRELQRQGCAVRVVMTRNATRFVAPITFAALSREAVVTDLFEGWGGKEMPHIAWASAADALVVAPATANIIAKFAHGLADDALSTLYLAVSAPVLIAPAMNSEMYRHPAVQENLAILKARGVHFVEPELGELACGWVGQGRLADVAGIAQAVMRLVSPRQDLAGRTVLVTAGPTQEDLDPVRFISNRSSGRMGYRLAEAARERGARVILVAGPTSLADPVGVDVLHVRSAADMERAVFDHLEGVECVLMAAAVSDFRPASVATAKQKKSPSARELSLVPTGDILRRLGQNKGARVLVGFAAETEALIENARSKLAEKNLDLIVANDVGRSDAGFGVDQNAAVLLTREGQQQELPLMSKAEMAHRIWDAVAARLARSSAGEAPAVGSAHE